ncbi:MAG: Eco57I restriction-modification methylase domain-containing protein, partial [Chloroflexi bacterium]|nr:Eco57I restriction-modification methylase domain-containing protein [Chloroflexota bacterium]
MEGLQLDAANLAETFASAQRLRPEKALASDWRSLHLLFQLTDEEVRAVTGGQRSLFESRRVDDKIIQSYLFFALELTGAAYTRTQLAAVTREINKLFAMPAMVLFKYGEALSFAIIHRRLHKRDLNKDVLEKVTLIKDIRVSNPHRAHLEILSDLAQANLYEKHPFTNFLELHQAWEKTLDISELNKRFYKDLANWYFWAVKNVTFPAGAGESEAERNQSSVIRLITRLIFIWFLKELDLIPDDLFDRRKLAGVVKFGAPGETVYYKAILQNLFFATLSQEMNCPEKPRQREFRAETAHGGSYANDYMVHGKYRYKALFERPERVLELFANIPFLNGGLFECLDRKSSEGREERVDGFSDHPKNPLHAPDVLFFADEHDEDLNEAYGTRGKRYKVRGLIPLLNQYKFTVEENTPIEEEVALDPELLGKVFENLLAAYNPETQTTVRKQTGSFYTPREIVEYMVDEALLAYLEAALLPRPQGFKKPLGSGLDEGREVEEKLRDLLAYNDQAHRFTSAEAEALVAAVDRIKVLDPAVGSGAFPMGVLHKLVHLLRKLDAGNTGWKERQMQKAQELTDSEVREQALRDIEQAFESNELDYGRKLYLIENCIYGVDIQPIAVQIARLRAFISLVVDQRREESRPNRGIRPLPNLETRFVAANTLLGLPRGRSGAEKKEKASRWPQDAQLEQLGRDLLGALEQHRKVQSAGARARYRGFSEELTAEINRRAASLGAAERVEAAALLAKADFNLDMAARELPGYQERQEARALALRRPEVEQKETELAEVRRRYFTARTYATKEKYRQRDDALRAELAGLLQKTEQLEAGISRQLAAWSPYEQTKAADFFDPEWMFGVTEGFDVVIANPPYVRQEQIKELKPALKRAYGDLFVGTADLYVYFYLRAQQ